MRWRTLARVGVLLAAISLVLASCSGHHAGLGGTKPPASSTSTTSDEPVRPCADGVLKVTVGRPGDVAVEMLGSDLATIEVINTGTRTCSVAGTPTYLNRTPSGNMVPLSHSVLGNGDGSAPRASPVVLTSSHSANHSHGYVTFRLFVTQCSEQGNLMVRLPGQSVPTVVPDGIGGQGWTTCSGSAVQVRPVSSADLLAGNVSPVTTTG